MNDMELIYSDCVVYGFSEEVLKRVFIRNGYTLEEVEKFLEERK